MGNTERWERRRAPTQDPSTDLVTASLAGQVRRRGHAGPKTNKTRTAAKVRLSQTNGVRGNRKEKGENARFAFLPVATGTSLRANQFNRTGGGCARSRTLPHGALLGAAAVACEGEQQCVVILVRNQGQCQLNKGDMR